MKEVTHAPHLHAVEEVAVQAIAGAGVVAGAGAIADRGPYLDLLGEAAVTVMIGDRGVLATAGAPCGRHLQRKRSAVPHLAEAGAQGAAAHRIR